MRKDSVGRGGIENDTNWNFEDLEEIQGSC